MRSIVSKLGVLSLLIVSACAPAAPQPAAPSQPVVTEQRDEQQLLRVAIPGMVGNPTPQASRTNLYQYWPMYDNLTRFGKGFAVEPSVATKWEVSADGLTWMFTLRSDLKFSNGDPLTADDAVFSINEIKAKNWPQLSYFEGFVEARAANPTTFEIKLNRKNAAIPNGGPFLWILPKKYYESVGFDGFLLKPIGSGPYTLAEFQQANQFRYVKRNEPHAFRKPIANEIQFRVIPDAAQIINGLVSGDIDVAVNVGWSGDQAKALKDRGMNVNAQLNSAAQIAMPQGSIELRDTPLKDKRVRTALNYAVNKAAIAQGLFGGFAEPTGQVATPGADYADPDAKPYPYDVARAKQLLAEAGYPNGFRLPGGLDYSSSRGEQNMLLAFQADMKAVGVEFDLISNEESVFVDKAYGRRDLPKGDFWSGGNAEDNGFFTGLRTFYGCDKPVGGPRRSMLYCSDTWDRLMDQAYGEADVAKRKALFVQANKTFQSDVPVVFLVTRSNFFVTSPKVRGADIPTPTSFNLDSIYKVK